MNNNYVTLADEDSPEFNFDDPRANKFLQLARLASLKGIPDDKLLPVVQAGLAKYGISNIDNPDLLKEMITPSDKEREQYAAYTQAKSNLKKPGGEPWAVPLERQMDTVPFSPKSWLYSNPYETEGGSDATDIIGSGVTQGLRVGSMAARTAHMAAGGLGTLLGMNKEAESEFEAVNRQREFEDELPQGTGKTGEKAGAFVGGLLAGGGPAGFMSMMANSQDVAAKEGDLGKAYKQAAIDAALAEASAGTGLLGRGLLSRAALQSTASAGLGAGARYLEGQDALDPGDIGRDLGAGLFGAMFPNGRGAKASPRSEEPAHFDTDFDLGADLHKANLRGAGDTKTTDLYSGAAEDVPTGKDFGPARQLGDVTKRGLLNLGSDTQAEILGYDRKPTVKPDEQLTRDIAPKQLPSDAINLDTSESSWPVVKPKARTEIKEETPGRIERQSYEFTLDENGVPKLSDETVTKAATARSKVDLLDAIKSARSELAPEAPDLSIRKGALGAELDQLNGPAAHVLTQGERAVDNGIAPQIFNRYRAGKLTTGELLDYIANDREGLLVKMPQFKALASYMLSIGRNSGGLDAIMTKYDPALHAAEIENAPHAGPGRASAYYDPNRNVVRFHQDVPTLPTMVHEASHALTQRALFNGDQGRLAPAAQESFARLSTLFDGLRTKAVREAAEAGREPSYGFHDLNEFVAELWSKDSFRNELKKIPVEAMGSGSMWRLGLAKVRNVYQAVMGSIRGMLGMPEKAETAMETMFSAVHDFASKLKPEDNMLPKQREAAVAAELREPEGEKTQLARGLAGSTLGAVRQAKDIRSGGTAAANQDANMMVLQYRKAIKNMSPEERSNLDNLIGRVRTNSADKDALAEISKVAPHLGRSLNRFARTRPEEGLKYAENLLTQDFPTEKERNLAAKAIEQRNTYTARTYAMHEIPEYGPNKVKLADAATKKLESGQQLTPREQEAKDQYDRLDRFVRDKIVPSDDQLSKLSNDELADLYHMYTGKELQDVAPLDKTGATARRAMAIDVLKERNAKLGDANTAVRHAIEKISGMNRDQGDTMVQYFSGLRAGRDPFTTRENVPKVLREWFGEEDSPIVQIAQTMRKQGIVNAQLSSLKHIYDSGIDKFLVRGDGHEGYTAHLTGEKFGPLAGLYTTPDVEKMLNSFVHQGQWMGSYSRALLGDTSGAAGLQKLAVDAIRASRFVSGIWKGKSIVGNILGAGSRNLVGSGLQLMSNGNTNPAAVWQGVRDVWQLVGLAHRSELSPTARDMLKLGLAEASQIQDAYSPKTRAVLRDFIDSKGFGQSSDPWGAFKSFWADRKIALRDQTNIAKEFYGAMDLWTKFANYHNELEFWKGQKTGMSEEALKRFVADRINDTNITPSRAWTIAKMSDAANVTQFAPYYAEVGRTLVNNLRIGIEDVKNGAADGNKAMVVHGAKRIMGTAGAVSFGTKALAFAVGGISTALGLALTKLDKDDPRRKYLDQVDQFKGGEPMKFTDKNGNEFVIDAGTLHPYDPVSRPLGLLAQAVTDPKNAGQHAKDAADVVMGMLGTSSLWGYVAKEIGGDKPPMAKTAPEAYNKMLETLVNEGFSKKNADRVITLMQGLSPKAVIEALKAREQPEGAGRALMATGVGVTQLSGQKDIKNYLGGQLNASVNEAKSNYMDLMKADINVDPAQVENQFKKSMSTVAKSYDKIQKAVALAKEQGIPRSKLADTLRSAGVNTDISAYLLNGKPLPAVEMVGSLESDLDKDLMNAKDPEERKQARERYQRNMKVIRSLYKNFRGKTVEEIANGE